MTRVDRGNSSVAAIGHETTGAPGHPNSKSPNRPKNSMLRNRQTDIATASLRQWPIALARVFQLISDLA